MNLILKGLLAPVTSLLQVVGKEVGGWLERRDARTAATLEVDLANARAKVEMAAYRMKAETEWDVEWAKGAQSSWKDEFLLILWTIPMVGLFIPWTRPSFEAGFTYLETVYPGATGAFMAGWAIIFAATFGIKQALQVMLPARIGNLATAFAALPDDIPDAIADQATKAITKGTSRG